MHHHVFAVVFFLGYILRLCQGDGIYHGLNVQTNLCRFYMASCRSFLESLTQSSTYSPPSLEEEKW